MTTPNPRIAALRAQWEETQAALQALIAQAVALRTTGQAVEAELALLLAPYPPGTLVHETYLRGSGRTHLPVTRCWQLEAPFFWYGIDRESLNYKAVLVKKDGTPGVQRTRIDAQAIMEGTPRGYARTTYRVVTDTGTAQEKADGTD